MKKYCEIRNSTNIFPKKFVYMKTISYLCVDTLVLKLVAYEQLIFVKNYLKKVLFLFCRMDFLL